MGAAFIRGLQKHALACVKHFACNSIEDSRLQVDVRVDEEVLDEVYLPAFERVVREGVGSVMSAYNSVNGEWCSQNRRLLTDILKERWGFDGFVMSDWHLRGARRPGGRERRPGPGDALPHVPGHAAGCGR